MRDITVLFLNDTFPSTAVGPVEVFRNAGSYGTCSPANVPSRASASPRLRSMAVPVQCDGPLKLQPEYALKDVRKCDLIFIPSTGVGFNNVLERNGRWFLG